MDDDETKRAERATWLHREMLERHKREEKELAERIAELGFELVMIPTLVAKGREDENGSR